MARNGISLDQHAKRMRETHSAESRCRSLSKCGQTEVLIEPESVFGTEALYGLVDHWLAPMIAEQLVRDLISSGEPEEDS